MMTQPTRSALHSTDCIYRVKTVSSIICAVILACSMASAQKPNQYWPHYRKAEAKYRALFLQDENGEIAPDGLMKAIEQKQKMRYDPTPFPGQNGPGPKVAGIGPAAWVWLGPGNVGGRTRSILVHPGDTNTLWAGTVGGGVWKTVDSGAHWFPLDDFMANLAIGSMVMDPTDPNVIYAGTGEGFSNGDALRGAGIFKTSNGGTNWAQLSATANSSFFFVNRLSISPTNHSLVLAATSTGIWRSTNAGTTWSQRYSTAGMLYVACHPTDGARCVASGSNGRGIYSTDGGLTWNNATGLPVSGRVELAFAPSSSSIVYAGVETNSGTLYISTDGGVSYTVRNTGLNYLGSQGWYDNLVWVDPTNPNIVIIGGLDVWRSTNAGTNFTDIGGYSGGIHPDQHVVVNGAAFNGTTVRTLYVGNDGGIFRATDAYTVSTSSGWTELNNNLGATQFYGAAGNATSGVVIGGTQDNGTIRVAPGAGTESWTAMFGGDGGYCAADPSDTNYFYGEYVYLQIHRSSNGGLSSSYIDGGIGDAGVPDGGDEPDDPDASANFIAPFILDPNNPNIMLAGGSNLWRSVDIKAPTPTWTNIRTNTGTGSFISAIAVAPGNSDIIWIGFNNGDVYASADGTGANPTWTRKDLGTPNLPNRAVTRLVIDPLDANIVYACFGGFNSDNIYRTANGGTTWANIAAGLPAAPVRALVLAPFTNTYLYAGTEVGVFASTNTGANWSTSNDGGANASVNELFWLGNTLVEATHGRGMFKILVSTTPVINLPAAKLAAQNCPPGNGAIDPGETVIVNFTLANTVAVPTSNLVATLLVTNGVTAPGAPQSFGALTAGGGAVTKSFSFTATGACGGTITATLQLQDGTNSLGTVSATFPLGQNTVWSENFDAVTPPALPAGWTVTWSGAGAAWATASAASDSAPNSVFAPDPSNPSDNQLTSPSLPIATGTTQLTFRHSFATEDGFDGGALEISIGGGSFTDILTAGGSFVANGYNRTISTCCSNPLAGRQGWSGTSGGFITTTVNLPPAAVGQSVRFRWRFGSDVGTSAPGWYVDNVALVDAFNCCSGAYTNADLGVNQSVSPPAVNLGSNVTFTVTITNLGLNIASDVSVTNVLPVGLSFVSASTSQGTWATNAGVLTLNAGPLSNAANVTLTITARCLTNGVFTNTCSVGSSTSDPVSANNTSSTSVTVNLLPGILAIANQTTPEDTPTAAIGFVIGDVETPAASLTVSGFTTNTTLLPLTNIVFGGSGSNRTVTLTPANNANGATTVTITVSDGVGSASSSFLFTVNAVNDPPVLATISNRVIFELSTLTFTNTASDPEVPTQTLTFSLSNAPPGAVINSSNGVFTWTPSEANGPSTNQITVIVTDNGSPNLSDAKAFTVTVLESNTPPILPIQSNLTITGLVTVVVTNAATDSDLPANTLTYSLATGPTNAVINTAGVITWTPVPAQLPSTNLFTTVVTDDSPLAANAQHLSATNSFTVTAFAEPPVPPTITALSVSNDLVTITWQSVSSHTYRVEYKGDLSDLTWSNLSPDVTASGAQTTTSNAINSVTQRFYRVLLLP